MRLDVFTLFPDAFTWFSQQPHVARARELGVALNLWDYRVHTPLRHGQVDDAPYGGGAGMVLRIDVICAALEAVFGGDAVLRAGSSYRAFGRAFSRVAAWLGGYASGRRWRAGNGASCCSAR